MGENKMLVKVKIPKNPANSFYMRAKKLAARIRKNIVPLLTETNRKSGHSMAAIVRTEKPVFRVEGLDCYILPTIMSDMLYWIEEEYNKFIKKKYYYLNAPLRDEFVILIDEFLEMTDKLPCPYSCKKKQSN